MALSSNDGVFTESYWGMHRNALFFSAALLIFSAPDLSVGGTSPAFFISEIGPKAAHLLFLIIALSASYSLLVFTLEWRQQALPLMKLRHAEIIDRMRLDSETIDAVRPALVGVAKMSDSFREHLSLATNTHLIAKHHDDIKAEFAKKIVIGRTRFKNEVIHYFNPAATKPLEASVTITDAEDLNKRFFAYEERIFNIAAEQAQRIVASNSSSLKNLETEIFGLANKIQLLTSPKVSRFIFWRGIIHRSGMALDFIRVYVVGLLLPWILFGIAFAHYVGKNYVAPFESWLF